MGGGYGHTGGGYGHYPNNYNPMRGGRQRGRGASHPYKRGPDTNIRLTSSGAEVPCHAWIRYNHNKGNPATPLQCPKLASNNPCSRSHKWPANIPPAEQNDITQAVINSNVSLPHPRATNVDIPFEPPTHTPPKHPPHHTERTILDIRTLYPNLGGASLQATVAAAAAATSEKHARQQAENAGREYLSHHDIDRGAVHNATTEFKTEDPTIVIRRYQHHIHQHTLQLNTLKSDYQNDPEYNTLIELATQGATPIPPHDFQPNMGSGTKIRRGKTPTPLALRAHAAIAQREGHAIIVHREALPHIAKYLPVHVSEASVCAKPGKPLGRAIFDYSHTREGSPPNHESQKSAHADKYGAIRHGTLSDLCSAVIAAEETTGPGHAWGGEMDANGAYTHILESPQGASIHMVLVAEDQTNPAHDLILIPLVMFFGSQTAPYCWEVVGRALTRRSNARGTHGVTYADDRSNYGTHEAAHAEMHAFQTDAEALLGPRAIQHTKTRLSRTPTSIGWTFLLQQRLVIPSQKGIRKLLACFFHDITHLDAAIPVTTLQRAGQLACRYSQAFPSLEPYVHALFPKSNANPNASRKLSAAGREAVRAWRSLLKTAITDITTLAAPIEWPILSQLTNEELATRAHHVLWADAQTGHNGIGAIWPNVQHACTAFPRITILNENGERHPLHVNQLEFIAVICAVLICANHITRTAGAHALRGRVIFIWSDNTTCIAWVHRCKARTLFDQCIMALLRDIQVTLGIFVASAHVAGPRNIHADALSRNFHCPNGAAIRHHIKTSSTEAPPLRTFLESMARQYLECENGTMPREQTSRTMLQHALTYIGVQPKTSTLMTSGTDLM